MPVIASAGTGPQKRLSSDSPRKSPARNQVPAGTVIAVGSSQKRSVHRRAYGSRTARPLRTTRPWRNATRSPGPATTRLMKTMSDSPGVASRPRGQCPPAARLNRLRWPAHELPRPRRTRYWARSSVEQALQGGAQSLQLLGARQLRPALLDALGGRVRHRPDGLAALVEEHQPRAAVLLVRAALDVPHAARAGRPPAPSSARAPGRARRAPTP